MPDVIDDTEKTVDGASQDNDNSEANDQTTASGADTDKDGSATDGQDTDQTGADTKPQGVTEKQNQFIESLLVEFDLETPEELLDFVGSLAEINEKLEGEDVDDLLANKDLMLKYQKAWAAQDAAKLEEGETQEETIARLKKEKSDVEMKMAKGRAREKEAKEAQKALSTFNSTVNKTIRGIKEIPQAYRPFLSLFMGVDNPINDVDLGDKGKVIDLTKKGAKQLLEFEQAVIKRYLDGKAKVPKVDTASETSNTEEPKKVKNLSEARETAKQKIKEMLAAKKNQQ